MSNLVSRATKAAFGAVALLVVSSGATVMSTTSAEAQWGPRPGWGGPGFRPARHAYGHGYRHRPARGGAVAAGIIGGIAAGALIAGATRPAYAAPAYNYGYAPAYQQPTYYQPAYEPAYSYQPTCHFRKVRQVVDEDTVVIRRVRVCQ
jgi:hypothetical protein